VCRVLLIAASRRAHVGSTCFLFQAAPAIGPVPGFRVDQIRWSGRLPETEEPTDLAGVEMFGEPQGPAERPTALCHVEAPRIGVQPRSPAGEAVPRVGDDHPVHGHDAQ